MTKVISADDKRVVLLHIDQEKKDDFWTIRTMIMRDNDAPVDKKVRVSRAELASIFNIVKDNP